MPVIPEEWKHAFGRLRARWMDEDTSGRDPLFGLVLGGGGARSAYQAGVLQYIAEAVPDAYFDIQTGVSAGAINTAHVANWTGSLQSGADALVDIWSALTMEDVVAIESSLSLLWHMLWRSDTSGAEAKARLTAADVRKKHGVLDTSPLHRYLCTHLQAQDGVLTGVEENLSRGRLRAAAIVTTNYTTAQTVTWVQGDDFDLWERPDRISRHDTLTIDHVMASTSLPLMFPAVQLGNGWYGDGGIRLSAPLAPAVHLGADRILAISNRYKRSRAEADVPVVKGYPPTAQIMGVLMNAIFLDALDQDAYTLERVNTLVDALPAHLHNGMRKIDLLQIRPSIDLGKLAYDYEENVPGAIRFLTTGLGTAETQSPDWLSVLLFDEAYITRLIEIGYHDAQAQRAEILAFFED